MSLFSSVKGLFFTNRKLQKIEQQLHRVYLPNSLQPVATLVDDLDLAEDELTITMRLPKGMHDKLEPLHQLLLEDLEKHHIEAINLHVIETNTLAEAEQQAADYRAQKLALSQTDSSPDQTIETDETATPDVAGQAVDVSTAQKEQDNLKNNLSAATAIPATVDAMQSASPTQANTAETKPEQANPAEKTAATTTERAAVPTQQQIKAHPQIQHVIVVASGKGGVGKSTTAVNLALALKKQGLKVGVMDADIYGPSIPLMLGNQDQSPLIENEMFIPLDAYGMPVISIGHLIGKKNTPVAWRGPKATGALMQLFQQTLWPKLDVLVIDMPPGTGDIQLTLAQRIPVSGAVIITTPQNVALLDAEKGLELFNKVDIPVLGIIENMSLHICSQCGFEEQIFGEGGGEQLSETHQVELLGRIPLNSEIRKHADQGRPSVISEDISAEYYNEISAKIWQKVKALPERARDHKRII